MTLQGDRVAPSVALRLARADRRILRVALTDEGLGELLDRLGHAARRDV